MRKLKLIIHHWKWKFLRCSLVWPILGYMFYAHRIYNLKEIHIQKNSYSAYLCGLEVPANDQIVKNILLEFDTDVYAFNANMQAINRVVCPKCIDEMGF